MNNEELIEKLRDYVMIIDGEIYADAVYSSVLFSQAADALEAKAAPAGEREAAIEAAYAAVVDGGWDSVKDMGIQMFKAGAAHQRQQVEHGDAYQGAREDLAIWKRRALEAEARVRQQDQIIDQMGEDLNAINGPTFMGEPVLPRQQAREVVMPKRKELPDLLLATYHENRGWNACLDEFARLNKGAGSHE